MAAGPGAGRDSELPVRCCSKFAAADSDLQVLTVTAVIRLHFADSKAARASPGGTATPSTAGGPGP